MVMTNNLNFIRFVETSRSCGTSLIRVSNTITMDMGNNSTSVGYDLPFAVALRRTSSTGCRYPLLILDIFPRLISLVIVVVFIGNPKRLSSTAIVPLSCIVALALSSTNSLALPSGQIDRRPHRLGGKEFSVFTGVKFLGVLPPSKSESS